MAKSPYYFDQEKADRAVAFFPRFLRLVEGEWTGRPFHLQPWQAHDVRQIFGWLRRDNGMRRYRFARLWMARKNGKTELAAGLAHLLAVGDGEPGAQVYSHALDGAQAAVSFEKAKRMVDFSPELARIYEAPTSRAIFCPSLMSSFKWLSGEAFGKHGLNPHANIGDEAHAWRNGNLHTFLIQGMGARRQPLDITISTAGEIKTYGHELYLASKAIQQDPTLDPETYVSIYEADAEDDWTDPKVWAKANPNLGVSLKLEFLESECKRALATPRLENDFKRYHLNIWVEQAKRWFPMRKWADNTRDPSDPDLWKSLAAEMEGRKGYCGIDLGSTDDLTVKVWVFPPLEKGGRVTLVPTFWIPEESVDERDTVRSPYRRWVNDGAILPTEGSVTDYDFLETEVINASRRYQLAHENGIAIDAWNATQVSTHLKNEGLPIALFGQGFKSMGAPSKELERLFISGQLEHGNHPVLKWMFGNAIYRKDPAGNIKPDKERAADKIDGVVATIMGLGLMNAADNESVYSAERGLLVLGT